MPFEISSSEKKGWFSPTLFKKNLTRFWPLVAGYTLLQFFVLPMQLLVDGSDYGRGYAAREWIPDSLLGGASLSVPFGAVFGLLAAMAFFSYLMNGRSAGMLHALPVRREGLFLTNWLSGLGFFLLPNTAVALLTLVVEGVYGGLRVGLTLRWLALHTVIGMFFFCFAVCCAMFTGHILALPVFYGILNVLIEGLSLLVDNAVDILLVGYTGRSLASSALAQWCTPCQHLMIQVCDAEWDGPVVDVATGTAAALGYSIVLGAAFTLIAVLVYQHLQLERAGDVVTVGWMRPIFQYGVGVCVGLTLGTLLYYNFFRSIGVWAFVGLVSLCAVAGSFIGRMLLKKTLRVFGDGWKGCVTLGVCMFLLLGGARIDIFGYQRRVPSPEKVKSVIMTSVDTAPHDSGQYSMMITDPDLIEEVTAIHAGVVSDLGRVDQPGWYYEEDGEGYETASSVALRIYYTMESGEEISRRYFAVPITAEELARPDSYAARLQALLNRPEMVRECYLDWVKEERRTEVVGGWLNNVRGEETKPSLTYEQACLLWKAFQEDLDAGRIHRYLLDDRQREENCYYTDINFTLNTVWDDETGERQTRSNELCVTVQASATSTMAALKELGMEELLARRGDQGEWDREVITERTHIYETIDGGPGTVVVGAS